MICSCNLVLLTLFPIPQDDLNTTLLTWQSLFSAQIPQAFSLLSYGKWIPPKGEASFLEEDYKMNWLQIYPALLLIFQTFLHFSFVSNEPSLLL